MSSRWKRFAVVLGVFAASLLALAAAAGFFGGAPGFLWVLRHGATGPFAVIALHDGEVRLGSTLIALGLLSGAAVAVASKSSWLLILGAISAVAWVLVGMSVGV